MLDDEALAEALRRRVAELQEAVAEAQAAGLQVALTWEVEPAVGARVPAPTLAVTVARPL